VHSSCITKTEMLDLDCSASPTYGAQEGAAHNSHFERTCHHPFFVLNQVDDNSLSVMLEAGRKSATPRYRRFEG